MQEKAVGQQVIKAVRPGQQLVKIVYDELVVLLGENQAPIAHATVPPTVILLVGLQGSGKTTTAGKLAKRLKLEQKAPFLIAADVYRPAAAEQLATLGKQVDVGVHREDGVTDVVALVKRGIEAAGKARARTVLVDTAGRLQIDEDMMRELTRLKAAVHPHEILLVADGMTGQDAVRIAQGFHQALGITGVILTKMDGDARGGAALSDLRGDPGADQVRRRRREARRAGALPSRADGGPDPPAGRRAHPGGKGPGSGRRGRSQAAGQEGRLEEGPRSPGLSRRDEADAEARAAQERAAACCRG